LWGTGIGRTGVVEDRDGGGKVVRVIIHKKDKAFVITKGKKVKVKSDHDALLFFVTDYPSPWDATVLEKAH
jgi:hypothetical protein